MRHRPHACTQPRHRDQGRAAVSKAGRVRARTIHATAGRGRRRQQHPRLVTNPAGGATALDRLVQLRRRRDPALDPVLGHHAPARQQFRRARAGRACRRCSTSTTKPSSTAAARAAGQLRAGADHAARGRDGRCRRGAPTSSSIRAPATAPASAASRTTRRSAWRCARAIRCIS